jgi:tRNA (cmo5U34)-methyltransferase
VGQFHWRAESYLDLMRAEVPDYERLQDEATEATRRFEAAIVLELGTGTGETARRVLAAHPRARLTGIDSSEDMLAAARVLLDPARVDLRPGRLEDPLPAGPFDLVVSVLAVHHLKGQAKAGLFGRVEAVLRPGGRFVLADVVVPERPEDATTPISPDYDHPSSVADQLRWLSAAGLSATASWQHGDLAVMVADRPPQG